MNYKNCMVAILATVLLAGCNSKPAGVGSYIVSEDDGALMVQITSIEAGRVNGSFSVVTAVNGGKTQAVTRPLSGTIEGNALNLTVENGTGLSLVTGVIDGDDLRITMFANGSSTQATLAKSDAGKFEELANGQRYRAAEKLQEVETAAASKERIKQRSKIQDSIDRLADSMFDKSQEVQEKSKKTDIVIAEYRVGYSRVGKMRSAKQKFDAESVDDAYRISQLDYQIDGISNNMESVHTQVQSYMESLNGFMADARSQSSLLIAECAADELLNCSRLSSAKQTLTVNYQQFQKGYEREKTAYNGKRT